MGGRERLELHPSERRGQMDPDDALVSLVGPLAHCVAGAITIRNPLSQVLPNGYIPSVVGNPPRLVKLLLYFLVLPVVDHLALGAIRGVNGVAGHVPAIL